MKHLLATQVSSLTRAQALRMLKWARHPRRSGASALARIGEPEDIPALRRCTVSSDFYTRKAALDAIEAIELRAAGGRR